MGDHRPLPKGLAPSTETWEHVTRPTGRGRRPHEKRGGGADDLVGSVSLWRPREKWGRWFWRGLVAMLALPIFLAGLASIANAVIRGGRVAAPVSPLSDQGAQAFALRFAADYLTYDESQPDQYRQRLKPYLADGLDGMAGWDGKGKQQASLVLPVGSAVQPGGLRLVTVAAEVTGSRWLYLAVPVAGQSGSYLVTAIPALVPAPSRASWSPPNEGRLTDPEMSRQREADVAAFFKAYAASSPDLGYFEAPGVSYPGLSGAVALVGLQGLVVYQGGESREAEASVRWKDVSGATYRQLYRLRLQQSGGKWLVASLAPALSGGAL